MTKKLIGAMAKLLCLTIVLSALMTPGAAAKASGNAGLYGVSNKPTKVFINSVPVVLVHPILFDIQNNRTLYPFRELLEYIGARVEWDDVNREAKANYKGTDLVFPINSDLFHVNGEGRTMDTKTIIAEDLGRTYIPIRYAFEALGFNVDWIECRDLNQIRISGYGKYEPRTDERFLELYNSRATFYSMGEYYENDITNKNEYDIDTKNRLILMRGYESVNEPGCEIVYREYRGYKLEEGINPDINRQVYDLVNTLLDEGNYTWVFYDKEYSVLPIKYAWDPRDLEEVNASFFEFWFYEKKFFNARDHWGKKGLTDKCFMEMQVNSLVEYELGESKTEYYYEEKLRGALIALFDENEGKEILSFVLRKLVQERSIEGTNNIELAETKKFDTVEVNFHTDERRKLYFYFSRLE